MFYILLDGESSMKNCIVVTRRPNFPAPKPRYKDIEVSGVNGSYVEFDGTYENIDVEIEFNYITDPSNWHNVWRKVKSWLLKGGQRELQLSDDLGFYYKVKKIILNTNEREFINSAEFSATFTISPYEYVINGKELYTAEQCKYNQYDVCFPNYIITGEGMCTLTVNGKSMTANVGQNLTINTELQLAYRVDGVAQNTAVSGNYNDLKLLNGENEISITDGFDLKIQPNWRCL